MSPASCSKKMEIHLKLIGSLLVILSLVHIIFPRYFKWAEDLEKISLINRQMMYIHTFFIALVVMLIGLLCITSSHELCNTKLGANISLGLSIFWLIRLVIQFFGYSPSLWKGKKMETIIHVIFALLWLYLGTIFGLVWLQSNYIFTTIVQL